MASTFSDSDGTIIIDRDAAQVDVNNLTQAKEHVNASIAEVTQIQAEAETFTGDTAAYIQSACLMLLQELGTMVENIDITVDNINRTVAAYENTDQQLKTRIENA